ncbi:MAG: AI-2E family transporter [Candidatus Zambryskibacteria bacterium]|nr:AI-2E family transporter [Candidatus Zambryskibacteria bacterium]
MNDIRKISITTGSWMRLVIVLALAYAFLKVSQFILILIASIAIASAIEPVTVWARRQSVPRLPAVVAVYIFAALFLSGFFYFLLLPLIGEISAFVKTLTIYSNAVVNDSVLSGMFRTQNIFSGLDTPTLVRELSSYLNSFSRFLSQGIFSSLALVFGGVINFVLIVVLSFYLAVQDDGVGKFLKIITPINHEPYVIGLWKRSQRKIGLWLQGQLLLGVLVAILVYLGLLIIGVEHALLLAVLAGILELIPLFGPVLAAIPAVFVAYASLGMSSALIVALLYVLIQQLENHILYPMVVKKVVGMPPMVSIIALVVGGQLAGFLGILVAVPVAAVVMELLSDIEEKKIAKLSAAQ